MPKPSTQADRKRAEIAAVHFAHKLGAVSVVRAVRTQWQRQDLFGADVLGLDEKGCLIAIQATAGGNSAVTSRRRKLEAHPWDVLRHLVVVAQLRNWPDPNYRNRLLYGFRVHEWNGTEWELWDEIQPVPRSWFKAAKEEGDG